MGQARLTRIDAVQEMSAAVDTFRNEALAALEGLDMEIRRASEWIHHDRHDHWKHAVRTGWDKITEARLQLQQAKSSERHAHRKVDHQQRTHLKPPTGTTQDFDEKFTR